MPKVLRATEGKILTEGTIYGKVIYLAEGEDPKQYYEITEEEYQGILQSYDLLSMMQ